MRRVLLILAIVVALGAVSALAWKLGSSTPPAVPVVPTLSLEEIRGVWLARVSSTVAGYEQTQNATEARDRLLALTVPSELRDVHLSLVLAFQALVDQRKTGEQQLKQALNAYRKNVLK
ncbi:MAG: hypothetical protein Q7R83_04505 [bacterium]|nr:hypothetical protein [bacterium]